MGNAHAVSLPGGTPWPSGVAGPLRITATEGCAGTAYSPLAQGATPCRNKALVFGGRPDIGPPSGDSRVLA